MINCYHKQGETMEEKMEEKTNFDNGSSKNKVKIIVALSLFAVALTGFIIYDKVLTKKEVVDDKSNEKISSSENSSSSEEELSSVETEVDLNEVWSKLDGYWHNQEAYFFIHFFRDNNRAFVVSSYWFSEGGPVGEVVEIKEISANKYELKIFYAGGENLNDPGYIDEEIIINYIDLSNVDDKIIKWSANKDFKDYELYEFSAITEEEALPPINND